MSLSDRQIEDLNRAILDYLESSGYENASSVFKEEASVDTPSKPGILKRKWVSVVRLQRKVKSLEREVDSLTTTKPSFTTSGTDFFPVQPVRHNLKGHRDNVTSVRFHPEHDLICSASEDATIRVWEFESGKFEQVLKGHTGSVRDIAFDPTGTYLASCSNDLTIKIWDFRAFRCVKTLHGHDHTVSAIQYLPNGKHIISGSRDCTIKFWDTETGCIFITLHFSKFDQHNLTI
eukprot:TRINITY_DN3817_c0_g1_i1.p1 TRINITY_DN3817_c0_g1~~TRINITY_DN3817_c0_g1_i1.p1  ORF type:complete len:233 (-),score=34.89 TRINITY_DN3817_c0_g1_i1:634-1332(-)